MDSSGIFRESNLTLQGEISETEFNKGRMTVVIVPIHQKKNVLLVQTSNAPQDHMWWTLPQGGVEGGETLRQALFRELSEELNITENWTVLNLMRVLGESFNQIPPERNSKIALKRLIFVGVPIITHEGICLNKENRSCVFVSSSQALSALMSTVAKKRPNKHHATHSALAVAHKYGMLSWKPF